MTSIMNQAEIGTRGLGQEIQKAQMMIQTIQQMEHFNITSQEGWRRVQAQRIHAHLLEAGFEARCQIMIEKENPYGYTTRLPVDILAESRIPIRLSSGEELAAGILDLRSRLRNLDLPVGILIRLDHHGLEAHLVKKEGL